MKSLYIKKDNKINKSFYIKESIIEKIDIIKDKYNATNDKNNQIGRGDVIEFLVNDFFQDKI